MIPDALKEFKSLLNQYIESKDSYDQRLRDYEDQTSMNSTSPTKKKAFFFGIPDEDYNLNCRPLVTSIVLP